MRADIEVPFERPREREEILSSPECPELHKELINTLREELELSA